MALNLRDTNSLVSRLSVTMKKKVDEEISLHKRKSELKPMTPTTLIRPGLLKLDEPDK